MVKIKATVQQVVEREVVLDLELPVDIAKVQALVEAAKPDQFTDTHHSRPYVLCWKEVQ